MHFGIISPPVPGHLYPNGMIARELIRRGHKVTIYNIPDTRELIEKLGIDFYPIGEKRFPIHSWNSNWQPARTGSNLIKHFHVLKLHIGIASEMLRELPELIAVHEVEVLLVDQLQPQGAALAVKAGIPYITLCSILPIHVRKDGKIPPAFAWWQPTGSLPNQLLNRLAHFTAGIFSRPYLRMVNKKMREWELPLFSDLNQSFSSLLQVGVIPSAFDFPAADKIKNYTACGPFVSTREKVKFDWSLLDDQRPLIYVSMGTIRNSIPKIYKALIPALARFPEFQVVISKGGWTGHVIETGKLPANIMVVNYAPQLELLEKASLCITHAGPGTVMESLFYGVPMVCIPVTDDQPAMAARVRFHGIGITIPWRSVTSSKLDSAIRKVISEETFKIKCRQLSEIIRKDASVEKAVDLIESVLFPGG